MSKNHVFTDAANNHTHKLNDLRAIVKSLGGEATAENAAPGE